MLLATLRARVAGALLGLGLAGCTARSIAEPAAPGFDHPSIGRLAALVAALVGAFSLVNGARALTRAANRLPPNGRRRAAIIAVAASLSGVSLAGLVVVAAPGGVGTGHGVGGALVAIVLGMFGAILGWLALTRSRQRG